MESLAPAMPVSLDDLRAADIFRSVSEDMLAQVAMLGDGKLYEPGELVFQVGTPADHIFIVKTGLVGLYI